MWIKGLLRSKCQNWLLLISSFCVFVALKGFYLRYLIFWISLFMNMAPKSQCCQLLLVISVWIENFPNFWSSLNTNGQHSITHYCYIQLWKCHPSNERHLVNWCERNLNFVSNSYKDVSLVSIGSLKTFEFVLTKFLNKTFKIENRQIFRIG